MLFENIGPISVKENVFITVDFNDPPSSFDKKIFGEKFKEFLDNKNESESTFIYEGYWFIPAAEIPSTLPNNSSEVNKINLLGFKIQPDGKPRWSVADKKLKDYFKLHFAELSKIADREYSYTWILPECKEKGSTND